VTRPEDDDPHKDLAGVLHDVSNALTVLLGWVSEARSPEATPEAVAYALKIIEQRARIARDLARAAIGSPLFDVQRDLAAVVSEVAAALKVEAGKNGARIVVQPAGETARISGALDLSQVLTNLVMNAIAYAPPDSTVGIEVSLDDERSTIVVTDEGAGVEKERKERIFRGDSLRPGGAGVGLRHSRDLARANGGDVELLEHEGKGARFRIVWPRADAIPRPPVSASRVSELVGQRILVVEDDVAVTQLLSTGLEARGAEVTIVRSGADLGNAIAVGKYDAVLVDLSPIAGDVGGALSKVKASSPAARIVLISGSVDGVPDEAAAHTSELVRKPFELREVVAALSKPRGE
jgi:CheY-like chemotaxis protein